jgi:hypothetical protein
MTPLRPSLAHQSFRLLRLQTARTISRQPNSNSLAHSNPRLRTKVKARTRAKTNLLDSSNKAAVHKAVNVKATINNHAHVVLQ